MQRSSSSAVGNEIFNNEQCACHKSRKVTSQCESDVVRSQTLIYVCDLRRHVGQTRQINKAPKTRIGGAACQWAPYARRRDEYNDVTGNSLQGAPTSFMVQPHFCNDCVTAMTSGWETLYTGSMAPTGHTVYYFIIVNCLHVIVCKCYVLINAVDEPIRGFIGCQFREMVSGFLVC